MQDDLTGGTLADEVEIDETFIGGKARNMHKDRKRRANVPSANKGKSVVLGCWSAAAGFALRLFQIAQRTR